MIDAQQCTFEFVTWPPLFEMHHTCRRWPIDKFKENIETYLKVHCYAAMKYLDAWHPLNNRLYQTNSWP